MRRPQSATTYRPFWHPTGNGGGGAVDDEQREAALLLARRERNRRAQLAPHDNMLFNPMRHRMRYFQEMSERRRAR
jgi:hypothetical protein